MNVGDRIRTPRFNTVIVSEIFDSMRDMSNAGFTEPTHYRSDEWACYGRVTGPYTMMFAVCRKA